MSITVKNFKTENFQNPVGVNTTTPHFSWEIESNEQNVVQESYRIVVYEWINNFKWDSGVVKSAENYHVEYRGAKLSRDTQYFVTAYITVNGREFKLESTFRTGLLGFRYPNIAWIRANCEETDYKFSPYFRREFALKSDEIAYATAYIASRGWYELYINGTRPDDLEVMAPATATTWENSFIQSYDITNLLKTGFNCVGVHLGNGYSRNFRPSPAYHGGKRFWAFFSIVFTDGSYQHIFSDNGWKWHKSPIIRDHIYDGEWYDARLEIPGWSKPGFMDAAWQSVGYTHYHERLIEDLAEPVRILGTRPLDKITKLAENKYIYDFKYNGSGVLKIKVKGDPGAQIVMHHAENIFPDGSLQPWTNRNAESIDRYILKGDGEEVYAPRFTYHCFRYVEITVIGNAEILEAEALVYGTDMMSQSHFECSSDMINRIQENFIRTLKTNFMSWPTDTGVRDERTPCAMDSMVYEDMAMHNCMAENYYHRWLEKGIGEKGLPDWSGDSIVLIYLLWKNYGDIATVKKYYTDLRGLAWGMYELYLEGRFKKGFGDWSAPNPTNEYEDSFSSVLETNYTMWYRQMNMMAEMAEFMGEEYDKEQFLKFADIAKQEFYNGFYDESTKLFSDGKQSPNLLALANGMVDEKDRSAVLSALVKSIREKDDSHLDTGIFGTRKLIEVLSDSNEGLEVLYDILHQTTYPSFGQQIVGRDATTAWEQWYNLQGMFTCSHSMFCGIGVDFYRYFAGIRNGGNAYQKAVIKPIAPEKITSVTAALETVHGVYKVEWNRDGGFKMKVTVPANCSATVVLPDGTAHEVASGVYEF